MFLSRSLVRDICNQLSRCEDVKNIDVRCVPILSVRKSPLTPFSL